ncbi:hypothetical protein [Azospirillum sp. ST 5-10]
MAVAALASGPASAQTVEDYRTSLRQAPIVDATAPLTAELCRPLMNFVQIAIPDGERSVPWIAGLFGGTEDDAAVAAKRAACLEVRRQPLIDFANAQGEPIVTPPQLRDPDSDRTVW